MGHRACISRAKRADSEEAAPWNPRRSATVPAAYGDRLVASR
jgi:hypothetical protein